MPSSGISNINLKESDIYQVSTLQVMDLRLRLYPLKILDEMHFKTPREYPMHF